MNTDQKMIAQPDAVAVQIAIGAGLSRPAAEALVTRVMQHVDQTRAAAEADRQSRMPSDGEIDKLSHGFALQYQDHVRGFARALLSRYGNSHVGQPAASVIIDFEQIGSAGPFTVVDGRVSVPAVTVTDLAQRAQPAASAEPVIYIWFAQSGTDLDHIQYWTRDQAQAARQEARFDRPPMQLFRHPALVVAQPINMILHCPACGTQHVDAPDGNWTNPPHRSHLCANCGHVWRPADVATNGVATIRTKGRHDSAPVAAQAQPESQIPAGWVFFTADFSMHQRTGQGSVMLMRDKAGTDAWHKLTEEIQETTDLYATGDGATLREAIEEAARAAKGVDHG